MSTKKFLRLVMVFITIVVTASGAAMAQTVAVKQDTNGKWGFAYIDSRGNMGKWVGKAEFTAIEPYVDGYYLAQKDGKWGLYKSDGKKALDCKYDHDMISALSYIFAQEAGKPDKWAAWDKLASDNTSFKNVSITTVADSIFIVRGEIGSTYVTRRVQNDFIEAFGSGAKSILQMREGGDVKFLLTKNGVAIFNIGIVKNLFGDIYGCSTTQGVDIYNLSTGEYLASANSSIFQKPMPTNSTLLPIPMPSYSNMYMYISNTGKIYRDSVPGYFDDSRIIADGKGKYGIANSNGEIILPVEYEAISRGGERRLERDGSDGGYYYYVCKGGLWGIVASVDKKYTMIAECIYPYNEAGGNKQCPFAYLRYHKDKTNYGACFVVMSTGKAGVLDNFGKEVVQCQYDGAEYSEYPHFAYVYDNGKTIAYNLEDGSIMTRKYSGYTRISGALDYLLVEQNGKYGIVDSKDNVLVPIKYSRITEAVTSDNGHLNDGFHVWDANGHIGVVKVINGKGKEIVPCGRYDSIWGYESYGVIVVKNGKQGCIKENGAVFCKTVYDGHINGTKRVGFVKNSASSNDVTVDIYDYNGKYLTTATSGSDSWSIRYFVQKYLL